MNNDAKTMFKDILTFIGEIVTILLFMLLFWLFMVATPDQFSAECEILRAEMEAKQ